MAKNRGFVLKEEGNLVNRIEDDKYYTPESVSAFCIETTFDILGGENVEEIIEPSAGNGSFSKQIKGCIAYDISPEHPDIIKQDFLELQTPYKEGRLIIGNPPFGSRMNMAQKFFKKSVEIADYVAFILPISQLNNTNSLYEFDLIYSEDLGKQVYTDRELHCCFNIYKRPKSGKLNKKRRNKLKDITIIRQDSKKYNDVEDFDIRMGYWGDGSAGKILKEGEKYSAEYKIIINNESIKHRVREVLESVDWHQELNKIAMLKIQQFHIYELLKREVDGIK